MDFESPTVTPYNFILYSVQVVQVVLGPCDPTLIYIDRII